MTKHYAARKLLEHGPLSTSEFLEITGWTYASCIKVLARLRYEGFIRSWRRNGELGTLYELA